MPDLPTGATRTPLPSADVMSARNGNLEFGPFSPGRALEPIAPGLPIRQWDYPLNVNSNVQPRTMEPFGFAHLRAFSNVELVRVAIETRKDQLEGQEWQIKPREGVKAGSEDSRIKEITKFFEKPDGVTPFPAFCRALVEDLLSIDAASVELVRNRGGKLIGLEYVPGDTIVVKVDERGRRPRDPNAIAYQQVIKGSVWANLTNRDLLYLVRNIRPNHVYGFGPVEQIIITINTIIRRQASQLAYFTSGNVPAGFMTSPDGWSPDMIKEMQDWFDDKISGNQGEQRKIVWGPHDTKYQAFKDSPIKDDFDEWLARMVAFTFSLPPTPFVRQMNKGTAGEDQSRALEEGLEPLKLWQKRWLDGIIHDEFNAPDLEFVFQDNQTIDPQVQGKLDDMNLRNGSCTIDEVRADRGDDPLPNGEGSKARIYTAGGAVSLEELDNPPEPPPVIVAGAAIDPKASAPAPKAAAGKTKASAQSKEQQAAAKWLDAQILKKKASHSNCFH